MNNYDTVNLIVNYIIVFKHTTHRRCFILKAIIITLILITLFTTNKAIGGSINPQFDRSGEEIKITIKFYRNSKKVTKQFKRWLGSDIKKAKFRTLERKGWSEWSGKDRCAIHVIKPSSDKQSDRMTTIAHEILHCIYGKYHK